MRARLANGMVHLRRRYSATRVDHSGEAESAGLKMRATQVLVFGSPKAGTPLMVASPTLAIDRPQEALAWEGADGTVWRSYNGPGYLKPRHDGPDDVLKNRGTAVAVS